MLANGSKNIIIGLVIGILIGAGAIYVIDQSRVSQLNKQIDSLETEAEQLNDVIALKDDLLATQEEAIQALDALEEEVDAKDALVGQLQVLLEEVIKNFNTVNMLAAHQTYELEHALTQLHEYDPEVEPGTEILYVYGDSSFEDWWETWKGMPWEDWWSFVYP